MPNPFLTQIDSRAAIRGSRDPLSLVPIWSSFGRRVVGNLTTASTSLRGFTTLLLGYYCADRIAELSPEEAPLNVFLRVEQLVSYSRTSQNSKDTDYRGSERVKKRLEDSSRVTLSAAPHHQTLGDQRTYGLWGLYSVASRTSGLLLPDRASLTPEATDFVERQYIHKLDRAGLAGALLAAVGPSTKELDLARGANSLAHVLARFHSTKVTAEERAFFGRYLVDGGDEKNTDGQQLLLAALLDKVDTDEFEMADLERLIRLAEKQKQVELAGRLASIQRLERVIVAAADLFGFLLQCDGRRVDKVVQGVRLAWDKGLKTTKGDIADVVAKEIELVADAPESAAHLRNFAHHSGAGDWKAAIQGLIDFNASVMKRRGGAAWILNEKDTLKVYYREEGVDLSTPAELERPWQNTYFINALHGIKTELAH